MWRDERVQVVPTWAQDAESGVNSREVDRQLRRIARKRCRLAVDEARWLREAERLRVWRTLGFSTALEYLEDVFGYAPRTAMERLRVAKDLGELPGLEAKLKSGAVAWSAARELTRVMTPQNEGAWLERARGKNLRDIERLVAGHKKGDDPDAPKDAELMTRTLLLELVPRVDALWQQMRRVFENERGEHIDDVDLLEALCMRALEISSPSEGSRDPIPEPNGTSPAPSAKGKGKGKAPKPMHRIVTHRCEDCLRGWREGRGRLVEIPTAAVELATCDAEIVPAVQASELAEGVGADCAIAASSDADRGGAASSDGYDDLPRTKGGKIRTKRRPPPTLTIPKATRDFVWQRDHGCCRVPGCRATRNLTFHHIVFQCHGGDHDPENLITICDGHHKLLHDGLLTITGRAPDELTFKRNGKLLVDARSATELGAASSLRADVKAAAQTQARTGTRRSRFYDVVKIEQVKQALVQLKYKSRAARAAAQAACAHVGGDADIGTLVKAALELERRKHAAGPEPQLNDAGHRELHMGDAKQALVQLGYSATIAAAAVQAACAHVGGGADLVTLIKEALRRCTST